MRWKITLYIFPDLETCGVCPSSPSCCKYPNWKGDGYCDDDNNNEFCGFDGGDCCLDYDDWPDRDWFCNDCECKE